MNSFSELGLSKQALARVEEIGFTEPTEIQAKTISLILSGKDVMGSAETGSGKTAAYVLPIIERLGKPTRKTRALIVVPTRELALQVNAEVGRFGLHSRLRTAVLYGGTGYGKQIKDLRAGADIVVATPGRLSDLVAQRYVDLSTVEMFVLDEADRLMDLGFMPQVRKIIVHLPKVRQTVMFSATIDDRIARLGQEFLANPVRVAVSTEHVEPVSIDQSFHKIKELEKDALLLKLVSEAGNGSVLVFTRTRRKAATVARRLRNANVQAHEIHGDISQNQRERTLQHYREGKFPVLVATDLAARGLDIPSISHVVNYDVPQCPADYVHRIGRTGRAGRAGCSHTFICDGELGALRDIERLIGREPTKAPARLRSGSSRYGNGRHFGPRRVRR